MRSFGSALRDLRDLADEMLRQRRQQLRPVATAPCCCRSARSASGCEIWNFTPGRNRRRPSATARTRPTTRSPCRRSRSRTSPDRCVAPGLTRRRGISRTTLPSHCTNLNGGTSVGELDGRIAGQHVLQEPDPGLADAGFAVRQAREVRPDRLRHVRNTVSAVRQRNAADEMHDGMPAVICAHVSSPICSLPICVDPSTSPP